MQTNLGRKKNTAEKDGREEEPGQGVEELERERSRMKMREGECS